MEQLCGKGLNKITAGKILGVNDGKWIKIIFFSNLETIAYKEDIHDEFEAMRNIV